MAKARSFGNIRQLPSGRFQARYWHLGKQIAADVTFTTKTDAGAWLAAIETDIRRGDHASPASVRVCFGDYALRLALLLIGSHHASEEIVTASSTTRRLR